MRISMASSGQMGKEMVLHSDNRILFTSKKK